MCIARFDDNGNETSVCDCGNPLDDLTTMCSWCAEVEALRIAASQHEHAWFPHPLVGAIWCHTCGLIPLSVNDIVNEDSVLTHH